MLKVIIVSNSPWRSDNSFGNSFTNIFGGIENIEIANIYCKYGKPDNKIVKRYFQITEKSLLNHFLKKTPSGREVVVCSNEKNEQLEEGEKTFNSMKRHKNTFKFWVRGAIWKVFKPFSQELDDFIDSFAPDVVFINLYYSYYIHDINRYIMKRCNIPAVGYASDDVYSLNRFSLSPLFWIDRLIMHRKMKKVFNLCDNIYVISKVQKEEYEKVFGNKFSLLTKCADFVENKKPFSKIISKPYNILYAGNISKGRYKILIKLAKAIDCINTEYLQYELSIYTSSIIGKRNVEKLQKCKGVHLYPPISYREVCDKQNSADFLLHIEAFDIRERKAVHQSFSTKIVDYLFAQRCIIAIGDASCASIQYFKENECAIVIDDKKNIKTKMQMILETSPETIQHYVDKAWESGRLHHQRNEMQRELYQNLVEVVNKSRGAK